MENRFDIYELPEGHLERFEPRMEGCLRKVRTRRIFMRCTAVAACVALVLLLGRGGSRHFFGINKPEDVYSAYLEQVGELYELLASNSDDETVDWQAVLQELTDETVPLYDQLPEELSDREKTQILKDYYGGLLDEAGKLKPQENNKK